MGKKEQVPALAIFVQGSLWVWSATSRGRPPDGGLALAHAFSVESGSVVFVGRRHACPAQKMAPPRLEVYRGKRGRRSELTLKPFY